MLRLRAARKVIAQARRNRKRACVGVTTCNDFDLYLWSGTNDGKPRCHAEDEEWYCYTAFKYTNCLALSVPELKFEVEAQKGAVCFEEGDPPEKNVWKGIFKGIKPQLILYEVDNDHDYDVTKLEIRKKGRKEFLIGLFHVPSFRSEDGLTDEPLQSDIVT